MSCFVMRPLRSARKPTLSRCASGCGRRPCRSGIGSHGWVPAFERVKKSDLSGFALAVRAHPVAPALEPGSSLGSGGSFSSRSRSPPAAAVSGAMDGPRLRGRGDERMAPGRRPGCAAARLMEDPLDCVVKCHVPHAASEALRFRSCISFPPPRSVPFRPRRRRTLFARVSCVRAPARAGASCAGAVRAPDCARETEGVPSPSPPAGVFAAPDAALCREIGIGGSLTAPPLPHHRAYGSVHGGSTDLSCGTASQGGEAEPVEEGIG